MTAHEVATDHLQPGGERRDGARLLVDHAISSASGAARKLRSGTTLHDQSKSLMLAILQEPLNKSSGGPDPATCAQGDSAACPNFPPPEGCQAQPDGVAATPEKASFCAQSQNPADGRRRAKGQAPSRGNRQGQHPRSRVEHPFHTLKCVFGYTKARFKGLAKKPEIRRIISQNRNNSYRDFRQKSTFKMNATHSSGHPTYSEVP